MKKVSCYVKPHRLEMVRSAIAAVGVSGMTVSDVRGTGNSREKSAWLGGDPNLVALPIRSKVVVVVPDDLVEPVIQSILEAAQTGEPDDGKIFVEPVADAYRVRTGESGEDAV